MCPRFMIFDATDATCGAVYGATDVPINIDRSAQRHQIHSFFIKSIVKYMTKIPLCFRKVFEGTAMPLRKSAVITGGRSENHRKQITTVNMISIG